MDVTPSGCGLDDGQAQVIVTEGLAPYTFNWDEFPMQEGNSVEGLAPGSYGVTVTDAIGCVSEHEFILEMLPPESSIAHNNACAGEEVQFTVETNSGASDFNWYLADGTALSGDSVSHIFSLSGTQEVLLIMQGGCMDDTVQTTVEVWPLPTASFEYGPEIPTSRTPVDFVYTGSPAQDWLWDFGNGQTSSDRDPSLVFGLEGEYTVTLTVTDINGCVDTSALLLDLLAEPILVLPSAFVPEGVNQLWHGKGLGVEQVEIHVFARSGEALWSCVGVEECLDFGWDGTFNGSPVPQGAYAYRVDATFHNAKSWQSVGTVTLLR
jgi:gliding motility-associated-like protein